MRVLITGCNGFIGKNLDRFLRNGNYEVFGIDVKGEFTEFIYNVDLLDLSRLISTISEVNPDVVVHLAARVDISNDPFWKYDVNIVGVQNLITATESSDSVKRVIWVSTQLVNELGSEFLSYDYYNATTEYGKSKVVGEIIVRNSVRNKEWVIGRPSTVWGPGMSDHYQNFLKYIDKGLFFNITRRKIFKSFSYVENICFQIEKLISADSSFVNGKVFYLSDYTPIEMGSWSNLIAEELGRRRIISLNIIFSYILVSLFYVLKFFKILNKVPITFFTLKNMRTEYINNNDLMKLTGVLPYRIEDGVKSTVKWYKNRKKVI